MCHGSWWDLTYSWTLSNHNSWSTMTYIGGLCFSLCHGRDSGKLVWSASECMMADLVLPMLCTTCNAYLFLVNASCILSGHCCFGLLLACFVWFCIIFYLFIYLFLLFPTTSALTIFQILFNKHKPFGYRSPLSGFASSSIVLLTLGMIYMQKPLMFLR